MADGEGRLDHQTLAGKLPAVVAHRSSPTPVAASLDAMICTGSPCCAPTYTPQQITQETDPANDPQRTATCLQQIGTHISKRLINLTDRPIRRERRLSPDTAGNIRACREPHMPGFGSTDVPTLRRVIAMDVQATQVFPGGRRLPGL